MYMTEVAPLKRNESGKLGQAKVNCSYDVASRDDGNYAGVLINLQFRNALLVEVHDVCRQLKML